MTEFMQKIKESCSRTYFVEFILNEDGRWDEDDLIYQIGKAFENSEAETAYYFWRCGIEHGYKACLNEAGAELKPDIDSVEIVTQAIEKFESTWAQELSELNDIKPAVGPYFVEVSYVDFTSKYVKAVYETETEYYSGRGKDLA